MTWFHWVVKRLLWTPIVVSLEFNQNRAGLCMISMTCQLVHTLLTFLQWDPSLWIVFGRNLNGDHLGACANHRNGEFDVFQSLCPSNETRWRRTTFTTHGTVMQSTPNEDHYGPLQFQTIFLVHCRKIPKFHRTSQDTFLLPMGQQTGRSIWITQWKIQMPARKRQRALRPQRETSGEVQILMVGFQKTMLGTTPICTMWCLPHISDMERHSGTRSIMAMGPFEQQKYQNGNTT